MNIDKDLWLQAHMEAKRRNELNRKYGYHDHWDAICILFGLALFAGACFLPVGA